MKTCNKCKIEKELTEFHKDKGKKDGHSTCCKICAKARTAKWQVENKDRKNRNQAKYRNSNKELLAKRYKEYTANNPNIPRARLAKRRAKKLQATPHWLTEKDHDRIKHIYWMADLITKITGEQHHVDHITPLQGENVCGLHVPENLQILTATENLSKGNKWTT